MKRVYVQMHVCRVHMEARGQSNSVPLEPLPHQTGWPVSTASLHHPANPTTSHILLWVLGIKLRSLCFGGQTISTVPMGDVFFTVFPHGQCIHWWPPGFLLLSWWRTAWGEGKHEGNVSGQIFVKLLPLLLYTFARNE